MFLSKLLFFPVSFRCGNVDLLKSFDNDATLVPSFFMDSSTSLSMEILCRGNYGGKSFKILLERCQCCFPHEGKLSTVLYTTFYM